MAENKPIRRSSLTFGEKMIFIAGILLCLVLITTAMMGGLFARYTATGTGSDQARVAKFGDLTLVETGENISMVIPGVNIRKQVQVTFEPSEVATIVFVEISAPGWKTDDNKLFSRGEYLSWSVADGWTCLDPHTVPYVYYYELAPNAEFDSVDVIAPLLADEQLTDYHIFVSPEAPESFMQGLTGEELKITLKASVIQTGEFDSVQAAWEHLSSKN